MGCINLTRHWKFRRLARVVGSAPLARGILELLWESAYEAVSDYIGGPDEIADAVSWDGEPGDLVALLVDTGWLDHRAPGVFVVHDLWSHVPKYVKLRWTRAHPKATPPWEPVQPCHDASSSVPFSGTSHPIPSRYEERTAAAPPPQRVEKPVDAVENDGRPNVRVLLRLAHELHGESFDSESDIKEALKGLAAKHGLIYDAPSMNAVLDLLQHSRRPLEACVSRPARRAGGTR